MCKGGERPRLRAPPGLGVPNPEEKLIGLCSLPEDPTPGLPGAPESGLPGSPLQLADHSASPACGSGGIHPHCSFWVSGPLVFR